MPDPPGAEVSVATRLVILDIPTVDEKDHSFNVVGLLEMVWKDPRAKPGVYVEHVAAAQLETMWHPDLEIDNEREPRKSENQILSVKADGTVTWQERFDARLSASFDLHRLPFDSQELPIILQTFTVADNTRVRLTPSPESHVKDVSLSEWTVGGMHVTSHAADRQEADRYSELQYSVAITRRPSFYFYAIVVPSVLVVLVSFTTLWYDPRQYNAIIGPGVSCMLVLIALSFTVTSYLPRVSYVTTLNRFSLQCYCFVFASIVVNALAHALSHNGDEARPQLIRRISRIMLPTAFVISNLVIYFNAR